MKKIYTKDVLKALAVGGLVLGSVAIPHLPLAIGVVYKAWKEVNRRDLGRIMKRLEKQEMIAIGEKEGKTVITITEKGRKRLIAYDFENIELKTKQRDGKWRLVIFDIPEGKKANREVFRRKLMQLGFLRLQDSVFASAFPCKKEIDFLCHYLDISDYITLIVIDRIERGEQLIFKKYFYGDNQLL